MVANGYEPEFAEKTFKQLKGFGSYGFPESSSVLSICDRVLIREGG
jgi:DNA polymerase III alpha subunit